MKLVKFFTVLVCLSTMLLQFGCNTASTTAKPPRTAPKAGEKINYTGLYVDSVGVHSFSTADSTNRLIVELCAIDIVKPSPSNTAVAWVAYDTLKNETGLYAYSSETQQVTDLKHSHGNFSVNLIWNDDSLLYANFCETKQSKTGKRKEIISGTTDLINVNQNTVLSKSKPAKGAVLEAYIQEKYLVCSDYDGLYILDKTKNRLVKTIKGFSTYNMKSSSFSPDGKKLTWLEPKKGIDQSGINTSRTELMVANFDGTKEKKVIDFNYYPQNPVWSTTNNVIACDVVSQDWGNLRNIALYDVEEGKVSYVTGEDNGFVPDLSNCRWSPSGTSFIVRKKMESQFFRKLSYLIHNMETGVTSELKDAKGEVIEANKLGMPDQWLEDNVIVFNRLDQSTAYDIASNSFFAFPAGRKIIFINTVR